MIIKKTIIRRARRYQQTGQALSIGWIHSCLCYGSWGEMIVHDDHHPCCRHHHHHHHHHHEGWPQPGYAPRQHCRLRKGRVHHVTEQRHQRSLIIIIMMILTIMIIEVSPGGPRAVFVRSERIQTSNVSTIILPGPSSPLILRWHFNVVIIVKVIITRWWSSSLSSWSTRSLSGRCVSWRGLERQQVLLQLISNHQMQHWPHIKLFQNH